MKKQFIIGISLFACLFLYLITVHADSGQRYRVDSETLELRDAPNQNATVLTELNQDDKVTVFDESDGWGKTYYRGKEAWAAINQLTAANDTKTVQKGAEQSNSPPTKDKTSEQHIDGQLYQVQEPAINLRDAPGNHATIITELDYGDEVTIFEEDDGWGKTYYHGKERWVALHLLNEKEESTNSVAPEEGDKSTAKQNAENTEEENSDEQENKADISANNNEHNENNQDDQTKQNSDKTLSDYHFVIDPGHGGKDTGAIGSEVNEKAVTLATAQKVEKQLRDKGASVTLTRTDDSFIPLEKRVQVSNSEDTEAFISLHYNAADDQNVNGIYTYYYDGEENGKLANSIQESLMNHVNLTDHGANQADYQVLRDNQQLALLIELGFLTNPEEQKLIQTDSYQEKAAEGIAAGLEDYFNE